MLSPSPVPPLVPTFKTWVIAKGSERVQRTQSKNVLQIVIFRTLSNEREWLTGRYEISRLGGPASHGCIRLHPANAATLYALVSREGMGATTIVVSGR